MSADLNPGDVLLMDGFTLLDSMSAFEVSLEIMSIMAF
jgi:hypothetical protein